MATVVVMPQLGNTVESCLLTGWLVAEGDAVTETTDLCSIETDKSAMDVPAGATGTVLKLLASVGDDVPVKDPIAVVGEPGEDITDLVAGLSPQTSSGETAYHGTTAPETSSAPEDASSHPPIVPVAAPVPDPPSGDHLGTAAGASPRARGLARTHALDVTALTGTGPDGRVIARDVTAAAAAAPATKAARQLGASGPGTGLGGRATTADATAQRDVPVPAIAVAPQPAGPTSGGPISENLTSDQQVDEVTETPVTGIRKVIAERMMASLATSAQLTLHTSAPADHLLALRARFKASGDTLGLSGVTIGDLVNLAVVRTVGRYPMLNATLSDQVLRSHRAVHLGIAVDTPRGLMVPTITHADALSVAELSGRTKQLATQAIDGSISPDLLSGATFTVTNLGAFGIESFTPVLNVPQTGILGVSAITPRPTADGGVEQRLGLSLTIDHQVVDGADGARFLAELSDAIANIDLMGWS